jgi:hypothetical protein
MNIGSIASDDDNDCESSISSSIMECSVVVFAAPKRVYVAVVAFDSFSGLTFQCNSENNPTELYTAPVYNLALSEGRAKNYYIDVNTDHQVVSCATGSNGNADLYMNIGSIASDDDNDRESSSSSLQYWQHTKEFMLQCLHIPFSATKTLKMPPHPSQQLVNQQLTNQQLS